MEEIYQQNGLQAGYRTLGSCFFNDDYTRRPCIHISLINLSFWFLVCKASTSEVVVGAEDVAVGFY